MPDPFDFSTKQDLPPLLWKNKRLDRSVRLKLLSIAGEFIEYLSIPPELLNLQDVTITGSAANYNWTLGFSDIDLHLICYVDEKYRELISELATAKKDLWNANYPISIRGFDVELYVQHVNEPHASSGVYSIANDRWIIEPSKNYLADVDLDDVRALADELSADIEDAIDGCASDACLSAVKDKLKAVRKQGLDSTDGEMSVQNLAFKALRRTGKIGDLLAARKKLKTQQLSLR